MIKVILSTLISVFLLVCAVTIFYWRDSKFDPSSQDLLIFFGLIPLGISLVLLTPYFLVKAYKYRQAQKLEAEQQALEQQNRPAAPEKVKALEHVKLNVFSASLQSSFGQNQEVFTQIAEMSGANLDPSLVSAYGLPILSFRIDDLEDEADSDQDSDEMGSNDLNPLQRRMTKFIQRELENNTESLASIAEHLKQSAMFYDSQLAYEYRMHPAWINPNIDVHEEDEVKVTPVEVYRLNRINVHIVLADTLLHTWDESQSETVIGQYLDELGIIAQQINIEYHYWGAGNEYHEWINLIKNIQNQPHEVSLMLVQDSEIDQDVYDDRAWSVEGYIPAEFMSSCILAAQQVQVENLVATKVIDLVLNETQISTRLDELKLVTLEQYQEEIKFVVIPDDISQAKIVNKISENFEQTPIQSYHHLYSKSSLGHTQNLTKIFSFMLGLHASDELHSFIYSVEFPSTHVIIKPVDEEELTEFIDS